MVLPKLRNAVYTAKNCFGCVSYGARKLDAMPKIARRQNVVLPHFNH